MVKRKPGRPRIAPTGRRVNFRIADDQWRAVSRASKHAHMTPSAAIRASIAGKKGMFDHPTVDDGVEGVAFIETCVKSAASGKWIKFPKI